MAIYSAAMANYGFFTVNAADAVMSVRWIDCADDTNAKEIAESLVTEASGIEVWDVGRRVCKLPAADLGYRAGTNALI